MTYEFVKTCKQGAVGTLTLARERTRNAQNTQLLDEMDNALALLTEDEEVRVIILAAEGTHFSSGHDVKEGKIRIAEISVEERWAYESRRYFDYSMRIWDCPKPTIAQVQGGCIAGGFMLANMCDLIVASDDAFFSDPVVHSLAAAATEVLIHPWVMGLRKAKELLYSGGKITASEAHQIGMVNQVVPRDGLEAAAFALATKIAAAPPFAVRLIKRSLNRTFDVQGMRAALSAHFDTHQLSHRTDEYMSKRAHGVDKILPSASKS